MDIIDVTAAVIQKDGKFLIAKRKKGKHLEHKWEFPGGKVELGETPEDCLKRELQEELGVIAEVKGFFAESVFRYEDRHIRLLAYEALHIEGEFTPVDHDEVKWITISEFDDHDFPEADIPIIEKIRERNDL